MLRGKVIYIGSSLNMPQRVDQHRTNGRPFDNVFYIATLPTERAALERVLIAAVAPPGNIKGVNGSEQMTVTLGPNVTNDPL